MQTSWPTLRKNEQMGDMRVEKNGGKAVVLHPPHQCEVLLDDDSSFQ